MSANRRAGWFLVFLVAGVLGLVSRVVWLPDVIWVPRRVVARQALSNGIAVEVVQYWNRSDFYSTELVVRGPQGTIGSWTLDGDDYKCWGAKLSVNETNRMVTVKWNGRERTEKW